ncbi:MAG: alpha/beta fold hydrolase [Ktedonobacteraceae bacterium]|nr:alpha/beta fold hydrolase [Ktedonobacteraceae bacterium]
MARSSRRAAPRRGQRPVRHLSEAALRERTRHKRLHRRSRNLILLLVFLGLFALGFNRVLAYEDGVTRVTFTVQGALPVPVLEMRPAGGETSLVAVIAHGFSGSKDLMTSFGVELARAGVTAYLFDFPGHGESPVALAGDLTSPQNAQNNITALGEVVDYARTHNSATSTPNIVLLGHSMGSAAVGDYAMAHAGDSHIVATILVSPVGQEQPTTTQPRNLLLLVGQNDIPYIIANNTRLLKLGCNFSANPQTLPAECGSPLHGTGRRAVAIPTANHITILNTATTFSSMLDWLHRAYPQQVNTGHMAANTRNAWLLLGVAGILLAMFPLCSLLIDMFDINIAPRAFKGQDVLFFDLCAVLAILLTLGIQYVWRPFGFVQILLGDYVSGYFFFIALIMAAGILVIRRMLPIPLMRQVIAQIAVGLALGAILYFTLGQLSTFAWQRFTFTPPRLWRFAIVFVLIWPLFLLDEGINRGWQELGIIRGAVASLGFKVLLIVGLFAATLFTPGLGFLDIVLPVLALVFLLLVAFGTQIYASGRAAIAGATLSAFVMAWAMTTTFPITLS